MISYVFTFTNTFHRFQFVSIIIDQESIILFLVLSLALFPWTFFLSSVITVLASGEKMTSDNRAQAPLLRAPGLLGTTQTAAVSRGARLASASRALPSRGGGLSGRTFPAPLALRDGPVPGKGSVRPHRRGRSSSGHPRVPAGGGLRLPWAFGGSVPASGTCAKRPAPWARCQNSHTCFPRWLSQFTPPAAVKGPSLSTSLSLLVHPSL